jgi:tetratricopeptide (TPR) repeat protein
MMSLLLLVCTLLSVGFAASVEKALELGQAQFDRGNYRRAVELLQPFMQAEAKKKITPLQEWGVVTVLSNSYRFLLDYEAAFTFTQRLAELALDLVGPRSQTHAATLKGVCLVHLELRAFSDARVAIMESVSIMEELGLQQQEEYGSILTTLGDVEREQGRHREALVIYSHAKVVLDQFNAGYYYGLLLNNMAICFDGLQMWNEAVAFYSKSIEQGRSKFGDCHPEYAIRVHNLGDVYAKLKDYCHCRASCRCASRCKRRSGGRYEPHTSFIGVSTRPHFAGGD